MAGILKVDTLQSDSNLALKIATANVAFIDSTGLNVVGGNLTIGATQFAEGGQVQTAGIADGAVTNDKIASVNASVISSGTLGAARLPTGSVLQVVQGSTSTEVATTAGSYVDTGVTASITPSSASNKVLVTVSIVGIRKVNDNAIDFKLVRGLGDVQEFARFILDTSTTVLQTGSITYSYLDSPSTTSSATYKIQFKSGNGYVQVANAGLSTIILTEIAG